MKILHVTNMDFVIPYFFGKQFEFMKNNGIEVSVACSNTGSLSTLSEELHFKPFAIEIHRGISPIKDLKAFIILYKIIKIQKFDIVFGHTPKGALLSMSASFLASTKRRIYVRHGILLETSKGIIKFILYCIERLTAKLASEIICVSNSVKNRAVELNLGGNTKSIILGNGSANGIDSNIFSQNNFDINFVSGLKEKLGIVKEKIILGFVGRISKDKGIPDLIEAWKRIVATNPKLQLLIIGDFDDRDQISEETKKYILNEHSISYLSYTREITPYYTIMDIFILPSYREGLPTVILEASSMGLPIITTRATGCVDSIIENKTGIFTNHTIEDINNSITIYLDSPKLRLEHGKNGTDFVTTFFNQEFIWKAYLLFIRNVSS
jgi:glycosyltransferase involved in cell wall biosynthesis